MKFTRYPKRDAIRDYFPLPNEIFCLGLSSGGLLSMHICSDVKTEKPFSAIQAIKRSVTLSA